jgi:hypothetical protein
MSLLQTRRAGVVCAGRLVATQWNESPLQTRGAGFTCALFTL